MDYGYLKSKEAFKQAKRYLVGGVNSPVRSFASLNGSPLFFKRAQGSKIYDLDENEFIDYVASWGPHVLGHSNEAVVQAVQKVCSLGTGFGAPHELETELASTIVRCVPSIDKVRLVNSGTEATMSAVRLARGYTRRDKIVKFSGCYHGHGDSFLIKAGSGAMTLGQPNSPGITASVAADTLIVPYNDLSALEAVFSQQGEAIAAVIVEPVAGNMGLVLGQTDFLAFLRKITLKYQSVLIFDEVMTGFRVALGGVQELTGVIPDLTCLGKIIGAGLPVGAYGGREEIMQHLAPEGKVYQAGTLSGNPVSMAAGLALISQLERDRDLIYRELEAKGQLVEARLKTIQQDLQIPTYFSRIGSMFTLFFNRSKVVDFETAASSDVEMFGKYFYGLLKEKIYIPPSQFEANFISYAHSKEDLEYTLEMIEKVLFEIAKNNR